MNLCEKCSLQVWHEKKLAINLDTAYNTSRLPTATVIVSPAAILLLSPFVFLSALSLCGWSLVTLVFGAILLVKVSSLLISFLLGIRCEGRNSLSLPFSSLASRLSMVAVCSSVHRPQGNPLNSGRLPAHALHSGLSGRDSLCNYGNKSNGRSR